ncbi:MAG: hypothetical protein AAGF22_11585 [Pseudomonadota bacterium]
MPRTLALAALLMTAACADAPEKIGASYVSPLSYDRLNCQQLSDEAYRVGARSQQAIAAQQKQANDDAAATAVGLVLFWPALFFIDGDDETASDVARLKGEMEALEAANDAKGCGIKFRATEATDDA